MPYTSFRKLNKSIIDYIRTLFIQGSSFMSNECTIIVWHLSSIFWDISSDSLLLLNEIWLLLPPHCF